jgi:histidine decarboxylase
MFASARTHFTETRNWNNNFGASLLLANSPMSPKVVNGSFAALFDNGDDWSRKLLRSDMKDSSCECDIVLYMNRSTAM